MRPLPRSLRPLPRRLPRRDRDRLALPRRRRPGRLECLDLDRLPRPRCPRLELRGRLERLDLLFLGRPECGRRDRLRLSRCGVSIIKNVTHSSCLQVGKSISAKSSSHGCINK